MCPGIEAGHAERGDFERRNVSDAGSCAPVSVPRCDHATRNSFDRFCPTTLFSQVLSECWFDMFTVVRPGGVTWPLPELSGRRVPR